MPFQITRPASREYGDLIGPNRFLLVAENLGRCTQTVFPRPSPRPHIACACVSRNKNGLVYETRRRGRIIMMMTRIREIACEPILAQITGATYDAFRHVDSWILAREWLWVSFEGLGRHSRRVFRQFLLRSREIWPVSSLHRASTDVLIISPNLLNLCSTWYKTQNSIMTCGMNVRVTMQDARSSEFSNMSCHQRVVRNEITPSSKRLRLRDMFVSRSLQGRRYENRNADSITIIPIMNDPVEKKYKSNTVEERHNSTLHGLMSFFHQIKIT